ncbi:MAG: SRPBCC domain-containing protein [Candidatus Altimarinota bacterium]
MPTPLFINKSIRIEASAKRVWHALTDNEISKQWVSEFGIKSGKIISDWKQSSEISWEDENGKTIVSGKVISAKPPHNLHFSVTDVNSGPRPEITDEDGITYELIEANDKTTLMVKQGDFSKMREGAKARSASEKIWNKVLQKVKNIAEHMQNLENAGYKELHVCPLPPHQELDEHTHDVKTAHIILSGQLTIIDQHNNTQTYQADDRVEFPAKTTHKAIGGPEGGYMIVAF